MTISFTPNPGHRPPLPPAKPQPTHWHWLSLVSSLMRRNGWPTLTEAHNSLTFSSAVLTDPEDGSQYMVTITPMGSVEQ